MDGLAGEQAWLAVFDSLLTKSSLHDRRESEGTGETVVDLGTAGVEAREAYCGSAVTACCPS